MIITGDFSEVADEKLMNQEKSPNMVVLRLLGACCLVDGITTLPRSLLRDKECTTAAAGAP